MKLTQINAEEFDRLAFAEPHTSIYQSTCYANLMSKDNYYPVFLQAVNDNNTCTGLAMFLIRKKSFFTRKNTAYCPGGYLVNFYDKEELIEFNEQICKYLKDNENVDTIIIEPNLILNNEKNSAYLRYALENIGYSKQKDIQYYQIYIDRHKKIETNKNLSFIITKTNRRKTLLKYIDSKEENEYLDKYDAYKKYGTLYEISLDSFRSKSALKKNIEENNEYIKLYKDDYKYAEAIKEKNAENQRMNSILEAISRYEKLYGDNPPLALSFIINYSDIHMYDFLINRDSKDNLFEIEEVMVNSVCDDLKTSIINTLSSYHAMPVAVKLDLIGQYQTTI